jgi:gamma-glutamyltranspeptidase
MYDVMEDHGTTHTSVVDSDGMAVRITQGCAANRLSL